MYSPRGSLSYQELKNILDVRIDGDMRSLCLHSILCNYIEFDGTSTQLTDVGMEHYLEQQKQLKLSNQCSRRTARIGSFQLS
ncbi:hypothetical protein ACHELK_004113 [Vibrio vulnificus]